MCENHHHQPASDTASSTTAKCPVMPGSPVDKAEAELEGLVRDYNGQRYYLCCESCGPMWDADPARYAHGHNESVPA